MSVLAVRAALQARLGLDPAVISDSQVRVALSRAMRRLGYEDVHRLVRELDTMVEPWHAVVDEIVVSETWFFRDGTPFRFLAAHLRDAARSAPVRVLSLPCASGEEAYSAAITLREAGVPLARRSVVGADVSRRAVDAARDGAYAARAFRGGEETLRDRYFTADDAAGLWRVCADVRGVAEYRVANAVTGEGLDGVGRFDVVLCRNLLIYLSGDSRAAVLRRVRSLLRPDGLLIVGHAEPAIVREHGFRPIGPVSAFAFAAEERAAPVEAPVAARPVARVPVQATQADGVRTDADEWLLRARALADQGRHREALAISEAALRLTSPSADGYVMLGLLHDALGQGVEAEQATRRALYLDPRHPHALVHQALKAEARGDTAAASRLRARVRRLARAEGAA